MIDVALSILALMAGGLTLELFGAALPLAAEEREFSMEPDGYQTVEDLRAGNPS